MYLPANTQVARLDVQLDNGRFKSLQPNPGLSADQIAYRQSTQTYLSDKVTAVIRNPYPARLTYVEVSAVCYNSAGTIIGGGFTYMNFLLAGSTSPVEISITTSGVPARIDVYPHVSDLSAIGG